MGKIYYLYKKFAQENIDYAELSNILALLRAALHLHQTHHWQTHGDQYYSDHLLFQRLYQESEEFVDALAEKSVGLSSIDRVEATDQIASMHEFIDRAFESVPASNNPIDMIKRSLFIENLILETIKNYLENSKLISTHGLNNLLEGICDKHESFVYLLKQRLL